MKDREKKSFSNRRYSNLSRKKVFSKKKKRLRFWYVPGLIYIFIFGFLIWFFTSEDEIHILSRIKFSSFKVLNAQGSEKSDPTKEKEKEKSSLDSTKNQSKKKPQEEDESAARIMEKHNYLSALNERKKELDRRDRELSELESELHKQKREIDLRIKDLEKIRSEISTLFEEKIKVDEKKVKKLVDIYSNMKPQQAADALNIVNEDLAIAIMGKMKKKNTADILNLLPPDKAKRLSEVFAGYNRQQDLRK